jgi:hypothetical protein
MAYQKRAGREKGGGATCLMLSIAASCWVTWVPPCCAFLLRLDNVYSVSPGKQAAGRPLHWLSQQQQLPVSSDYTQHRRFSETLRPSYVCKGFQPGLLAWQGAAQRQDMHRHHEKAHSLSVALPPQMDQ